VSQGDHEPASPAARRGERQALDQAGAHTRRVWVEAVFDRLIPSRLKRYREQIQYLAVGAWNTLFGYGCFVVLYYAFHSVTSYSVIIVASYVISIANAYVGYRYVVFRSHGSVLRELPRFSVVYLITMAVNLVFFPLALRALPLNAYVIQALFTAGVVIVSYLGHKYFSFGAEGHGQGMGGRREKGIGEQVHHGDGS
jgi:putative flippase GtrA